jgi:hypothetical protein
VSSKQYVFDHLEKVILPEDLQVYLKQGLLLRHEESMLIVAASQAVSLKRIADALEKLVEAAS